MNYIGKRISGCFLALVAIFILIPVSNVFAQTLVATSSIDREQLIALTNADRVQSGANALAEDALLDEAAQMKANDMAARGYFSHVTPDGKSPWYWFSALGYWYLRAGENLAVNFPDSRAIETAWMQSPSHHANIVEPAYTKVGIGIARGIYNGEETTFVVQFFATPAHVAMHTPSQIALR